MTFHRSVFEKHGSFREELGRKGNLLIGGEDREIFRRLFQDGAPIFYEPDAIVAHKVEKERLSQDFMRRWFWDVGRTLGHQMDWQWHYAFTVAPIWVIWAFVQAISRFVKTRAYPTSTAAEKFASGIWILHYTAILWERFLHWLPFEIGKNWCAFAGENRTQNTGNREKHG